MTQPPVRNETTAQLPASRCALSPLPACADVPMEGPRCPCPLDDLTGITGTAPVLDVVRLATPGAVRALRTAVRRWTDTLDLDDDTAEDVVLLVDEAVTNVVEHAGHDRVCRVHLIARPRPCGAGWAVRVGDDGQWQPPPDDPGFRGRGVQLMGRLAHRSTITTGCGETAVTMCWSHRPPRPPS